MTGTDTAMTTYIIFMASSAMEAEPLSAPLGVYGCSSILQLLSSCQKIILSI